MNIDSERRQLEIGHFKLALRNPLVLGPELDRFLHESFKDAGEQTSTDLSC